MKTRPKKTGFTRRRLLRTAALGTLAAGGLALAYGPLRRWWRLACLDQAVAGGLGYGPLKRDPAGLLDLPEGFSYRIILEQGQPMSDGGRVPGSPDGTGVFLMADGSYRLVRNHELESHQHGRAPYGGGWRPPEKAFFDPGALGGTITTVLDRDLRVQKSFVSLAGTVRNCAGCATPWGSWLSCEESVKSPADGTNYQRVHGYVFEVPAAADGPADPVPLKAMGRFLHEGAAVDPGSGVVYQTEDRGDGCIYKFRPQAPGELSRGRLFALRVRDRPGLNTGNPAGGAAIAVGKPLPADWVELREPDSQDDTLRLQAKALGAATFVRGEGMAWRGKSVVFTATSGGAAGLGQLWEFAPDAQSPTGAGSLTLLAEAAEQCEFNKPDNLAVQPGGELIFAEDNRAYTRLIGLSADGRPYPFAYFRQDTSEELSGLAFSPDNRFMLASLYDLGLTLLITGPFHGAGRL